jgi:hypothetical protein
MTTASIPACPRYGGVGDFPVTSTIALRLQRAGPRAGSKRRGPYKCGSWKAVPFLVRAFGSLMPGDVVRARVMASSQLTAEISRAMEYKHSSTMDVCNA